MYLCCAASGCGGDGSAGTGYSPTSGTETAGSSSESFTTEGASAAATGTSAAATTAGATATSAVATTADETATSGTSGEPSATLFAPPLTIEHVDGRAAAVFDVDDDGGLDVVTVGGGQVNVLMRTATAPLAFSTTTFEGLSDEAPERYHTIESVSLHDIDRDGRLDLQLGYSNYTADRSLVPAVWLNAGDGRWQQRDIGNQALGSTRSVLFDDFDGDGFDDSFTQVSPYARYYPGNHNRFHRGTADWAAPEPNSIAALGLPGDFWFDTIDPVAGLANRSGKGAVVRDFDRDGRPDIVFGAYADLDFADPAYPGYPATWSRGLWLLHNRSIPGAVMFADVSETALQGPSPNARPDVVDGKPELAGPQMHVYNVVPLDADRDGDLDLMVLGPNNDSAHRAQEDDTDIVRFYRNDSTPGALAFVDVTESAGLARFNGFSVADKAQLNLAASAPIDVNNDGYVDLFSVNRLYASPDPAFEQCFVFVNRSGLAGEIAFSVVESDVHGVDQLGRDLSYGDLNGDGRQDIVIADGRPRGGTTGTDEFRVYLNNGLPLTTAATALEGLEQGHWTALDVRDAAGRWAIGAQVEVRGTAAAAPLLGYDEVRTDFAYRSKRAPRVHVGLGDALEVDVTVTYRGATYTFSRLGADRVHTVVLAP